MAFKTCEKCGTKAGPRSIVCKNCQHKFSTFFNSKPKKPVSVIRRIKKPRVEQVPWSELSKGDIIKVLIGSGPYWPIEDGDDQPMGYYGKFTVSSISNTGIHAYPINGGGHSFIYMGENCVSDMGIVRRAHRIKVIKRVVSHG